MIPNSGPHQLPRGPGQRLRRHLGISPLRIPTFYYARFLKISRAGCFLCISSPWSSLAVSASVIVTAMISLQVLSSQAAATFRSALCARSSLDHRCLLSIYADKRSFCRWPPRLLGPQHEPLSLVLCPLFLTPDTEPTTHPFSDTAGSGSGCTLHKPSSPLR